VDAVEAAVRAKENEVDEGRVEHLAVAFVRRYYEAQGFEVKNVTRARGEHGGYDLLAIKGSERIMAEVKGCSRPYGIPDPYCTEFDAESRRLIADVLCVVYFPPATEAPRLAIIPREAIPPEYIIEKRAYRISGKFKKKEVISKFFVDQ
jgi:hypothetical protein